jgi:hypothetical protein
MPLPMRRTTLSSSLRRHAAPVLLALAVASAHAQSALPGFSIRQDPAAEATSPWTLSITGNWPTQCPPTLQNVALDGNDLRIDARSMLDLCERRPSQFSIELNPALALQRSDMAPGVYRISFYAADGAQARPQLRAFALLDSSATGSAAIVPETGFWWSDTGDAGANRTVLSLELQGTQLSAALLSYDEVGQPVWYFGAAAYSGRIAQIPLLRLAGGNDPFSPASEAPRGTGAMTLDLQFASAARASAWLARPRAEDGALQLQTLQLTRLPLAENADGSAWQGDWVLVSDASETIPQRLHLDRYQTLDAQHFELADSTGAATLLCTRAPAQTSWPPGTCALHLADGSVGRFDSVGIARMDGRDDHDVAVHLLRVTP